MKKSEFMNGVDILYGKGYEFGFADLPRMYSAIGDISSQKWDNTCMSIGYMPSHPSAGFIINEAKR